MSNSVGLLSNRVKKVPSTEVAESRYKFLRLSDSEPDLGVPKQDSSFLLSSTTGERAWSEDVQFTPTNNSLTFQSAFSVKGSSETTSNPIFTRSNETVISTDLQTTGLTFSDDGTRLYVLQGDVLEYIDLDEEWSIPADASGGIIDFSASDPGFEDLSFGDNQTVYIAQSESILELDTISLLSSSFDISSQETTPASVDITKEGTKMFIVGSDSLSVHSYSFATAYDITTATYDDVQFDVSNEISEPICLRLKPDGTEMFILDSDSQLHLYILGVPWDISTALYRNTSIDFSLEGISPTGFYIRPDGSEIHFANLQGTFYKYNLEPAYDFVSYSEIQITNFSANDYGSAKLVIQATDLITGERQNSELLVVHNGTTASATEYGVIYTGDSPLAEFNVDIDSSAVIVLAETENNNTIEYKITETLFTA